MRTALERRDWHVAAAARRMMTLGVEVPMEALQRQAAEDLRHLDAARASGALRVRTDPKPTKRGLPAGSTPAQRQAERLGPKARAFTRPIAQARPRPTERITGVDAERLAAMCKRIKLIAAKVATIGAGDMIGSAFEYRALAQDLATVTINHNARRGVYAGKNTIDADKIYRRQIEDICDRSNAVIKPNWWAK